MAELGATDSLGSGKPWTAFIGYSCADRLGLKSPEWNKKAGWIQLPRNRKLTTRI